MSITDESECSLNRTFKYNREPWGREFIYAMVPQQTISFHCRHNYRITEDNLDFFKRMGPSECILATRHIYT